MIALLPEESGTGTSGLEDCVYLENESSFPPIHIMVYIVPD